MEADTCQSAYEAAVRLHRSIEAEVGDRRSLPRSSLGFTSSTQRLRSMSSDLTSELSSLRQSLGRLGPQLTGPELNRRRDLLEDLSRKAGSVRESITESGSLASDNRRSQLLEDLGTTSWAATPGTRAEHLPGVQETSRRVMPTRSGVRETQSSSGVATNNLRSDQDRMMQEQEEGLDLLGDIIRRQKGMGNQIFNEITQQNDLIDDIDDRVENVNQRLINTNDNISVVTKKDRTCGYWIIITILAIAILVVIFA